MDPFGAVMAICSLAARVEESLRAMDDLEDDAEVLLGLVLSVQRIMTAVRQELDSASVSKQESIVAFQGVQDALQACLNCLKDLSSKGRITRFLRAGDFIMGIKKCTDHLANQLSTLSVALGIERHIDLKHQFENVDRGLRNVKLVMLQAMQEQSVTLRTVVEQQLCAAREGGGPSISADEIRDIRDMMKCLQTHGVIAANGGAGPGSSSGISCAEAVQDVQEELKCMRLQKQQHEADVFEQILQVLKMLAQADEALLGAQTSTGGEAGPSRPHTTRDDTLMFMLQFFTCPITRLCMRDPVLTPLGHTYERKAIERHLRSMDTDPCTNVKLPSKKLLPNILLRNSIEEWLVQMNTTYEGADDMVSISAPISTPGPGPAPPVVRVTPIDLTPAATPRTSFNRRNNILPPETAPLVGRYCLAETEGEQELLRLAAASTSGPVDPPLNNAKLMAELLHRGTNPDVHDELGNTSLILASRGGDAKAVRTLLKYKANKEEVDRDANTALLVAAVGGHHEVVSVLLAAGASKDYMNGDPDTALLAATKAGKELVVQALVNAQVNKESCDMHGHTALMVAARLGRVAVIDILVDSGADKEVVDMDANTPLIAAAALGRVEAVRALLQGGADRTKRNTKGDSALVLCSMHNHVRVVQVLLEAGGQPQEELDRALHRAAAAGHDEVVRRLLQGGARRNARPYTSRGTALHVAIQEGRTRAAEALVQHGADIEARYEIHQRTALHLAAYHGRVDIARCLLERRAGTEAVDGLGFTPLLLACFESGAAVVRVLLDGGADARARDRRGRNATRLARLNEYEREGVIRVLSEAGALEKVGCCSIM